MFLLWNSSIAFSASFGSENSTTPKPLERPVRPSILTMLSTIVPQLLKVSASCSVVIS